MRLREPVATPPFSCFLQGSVLWRGWGWPPCTTPLRQERQALQLHCQPLFYRPRGPRWDPEGNSGADDAEPAVSR